MHKTLHKKLTEKHIDRHTQIMEHHDRKPGFLQEMELLREAANDLLQPRPQAIARLLQMAKSL